jgi:ferredoxin-type protein NapF
MVTRRQFLRGSFVRQPQAAALRPPWSQDESAFIERCTRCGDCLAVCPTQVIVKGGGGFPEISFAANACTFCGECAKACKTGAILRSEGAAPWSLKARIGNTCLAYHQTFCRSCGEACEVRAIRFSPVLGSAAEPLIDSDTCTGCGACVAICPARAIRVAANDFPEVAA